MRRRVTAFVALVFLAAAAFPARAAGPAIGNVTDNGPVPRYEKLEVTFTLGTSYPNPFDPSQIDIQVTFAGPGGVSRTVNAFWYQAYTRSGNTGGQVLAASGTPVWKARFAPHVAGPWTYQISARDASGTSVASSTGPVTVQASARRGFIHVSTADPRYFAYDDGTVYVPLGENVGWAGNGRTYQYDQWLSALAAQGGNFVRIWMAAWGMCVDWDWSHGSAWLGNYGNHLGDAWELDHVLDAADANGQAVMLCLLHHGQYSSTVNPVWADNIYRSTWGGPLATPGLVWTDATARELMKRRWRYLVARYAYSTALQSWELWNEMEWTDDYPARVAASAAWHQEMRDAIRAQDPYQHPVTTSYANGAAWGTSVFGAGMDLVQTHDYGSTDWAQYASDIAAGFLATYPGKPFFLGEFGLADDATSVAQDPGGLSIAEASWSSVMSKSAGGGAPWFWDGWIPNQNLYGRWKGISTFLSGEDLDRRSYVPVRPGVTTSIRADVGVSPAFAAWDRSPASAFTLSPNGQLTPDATQLGTYLHGSWQPALRNPPTFTVDYATAGQLEVVVAGVSASGTNTITIKLDGAPTPVNGTPVAAGTYSVNVPAGVHTILVDSSGEDWFQVSQFVFTGYAAILRAYALTGTGKVLGWVQSRNYTYWNQCASCQGGTARPLPVVSDGVLQLSGLSGDGLWNATFFGTVDGTAQGTTGATAVGGVLNLPLPALSQDLAFKLVRADGPSPVSRLYSVTPCRIVDTRNPAGTWGGPALAQSPAERTFPLASKCGVPASATAVVANLTVTQGAAAGSLSAFPGNGAAGNTATLVFRAGQTRANNAILKVSADGQASVTVRNGAAGTVHFILDVSGYFAP